MEEEIEEPWWQGPLKYILGLFLILLLVLWFFPSQAVKIDPEPKYIPVIEEVLSSNLHLSNSTFQINSKYDYLKPINPNNPVIKQTANKIVSLACDGNKVCQAKALYYFVQKNFEEPKKLAFSTSPEPRLLPILLLPPFVTQQGYERHCCDRFVSELGTFPPPDFQPLTVFPTYRDHQPAPIR